MLLLLVDLYFQQIPPSAVRLIEGACTRNGCLLYVS